MSSNFYVFTYGLLTDPNYMAESVGQRAFIENARFEFNYFANITTGHERVHGVLWSVTPELLATLDITENVPRLYVRKQIVAYTEQGKKVAFIYEMTPDSRREYQNVAPTKNYVNTLIAGYNHFHLDTAQILKALNGSEKTTSKRS